MIRGCDLESLGVVAEAWRGWEGLQTDQGNARQLRPGGAGACLSNGEGGASTVGSEVFCKIDDKRVFFFF